MAQGIQIETFVFDAPLARGDVVLKMAAKRYTRSSRTDTRAEQGFTLLFAHGTGFHKELWEPTIAKLFEICSSDDHLCGIREAWTFDWQGHGDSAVLNKFALRTYKDGIFPADWAHAFVAFLNSSHVRGHRLVAMGHSAGATAFMYTTKLFPHGCIPYTGIILVESPLIDRETFQKHLQRREQALTVMKKAVRSRRDIWPNKEQAFEWLRSRLPWKTWDERVLRLFCEYGLYPAPEGAAPGSVTTKCDKVEEAKSYEAPGVEQTFEAIEQIEKVCHKIPIHVIFGEINDLIPRYSQDATVDQSKGRKAASISRVPGAGHMIVQQKPDILASYLSGILDGMCAPTSRL